MTKPDQLGPRYIVVHDRAAWRVIDTDTDTTVCIGPFSYDTAERAATAARIARLLNEEEGRT